MNDSQDIFQKSCLHGLCVQSMCYIITEIGIGADPKGEGNTVAEIRSSSMSYLRCAKVFQDDIEQHFHYAGQTLNALNSFSEKKIYVSQFFPEVMRKQKDTSWACSPAFLSALSPSEALKGMLHSG